MADKTSPVRQTATDESRDQAAISDDIEKIVGYLNNKRSNASDRASDLMQEISHRREELSERRGEVANGDGPKQLHELARKTRERAPSDMSSSPVLAERYHAFCRDLDELLDSFRARVDQKKRIRH